MASIQKYVIVHIESGDCVFVTYAPCEQDALDEYAAVRSGYDTLAEMARSGTFRDLANVRCS
jgi:hypothetical protein